MNLGKIGISKNVKKCRCSTGGFTLIEILLAFSIFSFLIIFIVHAIPLLKYHAYSNENVDQLHWEIFLNQVKREIRTVDQIYLYNRRMDCITDRRIIIYEQYGERLRRRVNYEGHEIILFNISQIEFEQINKGIKIKIVHKNGKTYEGDIYFPNEIPIYKS